MSYLVHERIPCKTQTQQHKNNKASRQTVIAKTSTPNVTAGLMYLFLVFSNGSVEKVVSCGELPISTWKTPNHIIAIR